MSAQIIDFRAAPVSLMRNIERVWRLRQQAIEHVRAIEDLCEQMEQLPEVWGILPSEVGQYLDEAEKMLTPTDIGDDERGGWDDEILAMWDAWQAFKKSGGAVGLDES